MLLPKELRSRRLSLDDLARLAGVEQSVLAAMESGDAPISAAVIAALIGLEREREP